MIEREIIPHQLSRPAGKQKRIATLLDSDWRIGDRTDEPVIDRFPVKHLAGVKRLLQIEIRRRNFAQLHFSTVARCKNSVT